MEKTKYKGIQEVLKKNGMKIHTPKENLLKELETYKDAEFMKEHELKELGNLKWRAWKEYDLLAKRFATFRIDLETIKRKRYELMCKYKGVKPVIDEKEQEILANKHNSL